MNLNRLTIAGLGVLLLLGLVYFPLNERTGSPESPIFESRSAGSMPGTSSNDRVDTQASGELELDYLNFDEVAADLSDLTREELIERFNPRPRAPMSFAEAISSTHPLDRAERIYGTRWKGFVESLNLSDAEIGRVREMFVAHEAHNAELRDLYWSGEISMEEHAGARRTHGQLAASLGQLLGDDQVARFWATTESQAENAQLAREQLDAHRLANGEVGILDASNRGDTASVQAYIDSGADVNAATLDGRQTPLLNAVFERNPEMVRMLIEAGADPDLSTTGDIRTTPLGRAASMGDVEVIRSLVAGGADIDLGPNGPGFSPLATASLAGHTAAVAALLELGADATGVAGTRALNDSIRYGNREMEQMLIEAGASGNLSTFMAREFKEIGRRLGVVND